MEQNKMAVMPMKKLVINMSLNKDFDGQMKKILQNIKNHKMGYERTKQEEILHHKKIMDMAKTEPELFDGSLLKITHKCIGCGVCVLVCPNGKYSLKDNVAIREDGKCDYCQACAQNCPIKAIIPGKTDKNPKARFRNEQITLQELVEANNIRD